MQKKIVYFPNLDGIRFFAFFAVFFSHLVFFKVSYDKPEYGLLGKSFFHNGDLGVTLFFVLSGFLITYLLIQEKSYSNRIDIKSFYIRRILRIWPLYILNLLIGFFLIPLLIDHPAISQLSYQELLATDKVNSSYYLLFLGNFDFGSFIGKRNVFIGILWSVCVEEQFYFVWPFVIAFLDRRKLTVTLFLIVLFSTSYRLFIAKGSYGPVHYFTWSCISDMAIGALVANLVSTNVRFLDWVKNLKKSEILFLYLVFVSALILRQCRFSEIRLNSVMTATWPVIFSVIFALIILEQNFSENSIFKLGKMKHFGEFGRYTYFSYCFHYHIFLMILILSFYLFGTSIAEPTWFVIFFEIACAYALIFILGKISFNTIERPFMKLKTRFSYIVRKES